MSQEQIADYSKANFSQSAIVLFTSSRVVLGFIKHILKTTYPRSMVVTNSASPEAIIFVAIF